MATNRRRTSRTRGQGIPPHARWLFRIGAGWNSYGDEEVKRLWNEYGDLYLATNQGPCFAEQVLGKPEKPES